MKTEFLKNEPLFGKYNPLGEIWEGFITITEEV
jgi:hypothetical protein